MRKKRSFDPKEVVSLILDKNIEVFLGNCFGN